ncbi:hypothetical protein DPEC_G00194690 [Dallia pectoralis]|uniref:Uncharacterized protein n=1 Tax=Dallia pectoralis TaxID=75939 RepID=A0ACC2G774_DALPE|nr:hypothetical protein DPEC_G00194690 [Dallia pectoralis]
MMAVRERAVKVMAALERRVPSIDDFVGQSWSAWAEKAVVTASEGSEGDDCSKNGKTAAEAMYLRKEDMSIFGHYPGQDDFYLVVCSHCGQVVKPQAFEKHCERRHGPLGKLCTRLRSPPSAAQHRPRHGHSPSGTHTTSTSSWDGRGQGTGVPRAAPQSPSTPPQFRHKPPKEGVRLTSLDKSLYGSQSESAVFKQPPPLEPPLSSPSPSLRDPPWPHGGTSPARPPPTLQPHPAGHHPRRIPDLLPRPRPDLPHAPARPSPTPSIRPSPTPPTRRSPTPTARTSSTPPGRSSATSPGRPSTSERTHTQRKEASSASTLPGHLRGPRPYNKVASKRECDLDKHCGVLDPERKKVCTRLLTCNIHSIHQRRKVTGRSKDFDQLVAELKTGSRVRERGGQTHEGSGSGRSPSPEASPHCRRPLTNNPAFSRSRVSSESATEEDRPRQEGGTRAPSPLVHGHISSDESDEDCSEETIEYPSSSWHPKPAAVCSFGSQVMGHGVYTFDRRLHHLRSAFSVMVEDHISAHLWKKIPQASDHQTTQSSPVKNIPSSSSPSSSSRHSKVRTGSHSAPSVRHSSSSHGPGRESRLELSSHSTVVNQSENSGSSSGSHAAAPAASPVRPVGPGRPPGPGRTKNPVGRPSKQQLRLREEAAAAAALRKRKAPSQEGEHSGPDRNCILLQDRGRPPSTSSKTAPPTPHSLTNGTLSPGSKPRPPPPPSETSSQIAAWSFKRTHPPSGQSSSPPDPHTRGGDLGVHGRGASGGYEHRGLGKKRKGGSSEPSPPSKPHRLPSSPRSSYYPWKDSKGAALPGGVEKKMGTQKPKLHH